MRAPSRQSISELCLGEGEAKAVALWGTCFAHSCGFRGNPKLLRCTAISMVPDCPMRNCGSLFAGLLLQQLHKVARA